MNGPIVTYNCPLGGRHAIPSENVRVMKTGDGDFIVACTCGEEDLEDVDERPHPSPDQFVNIDANAPSPSKWLRLERCADGWYDVEPWEPPEDFQGTRAQRRARVRDRAEELADDSGPIDGEHDDRDETAREVPCPYCEANAGIKCKRPSGHRVRSSHADRIEAAEQAGLFGENNADEEPKTVQGELKAFGV